MCGRFSLSVEDFELKKRFNVEIDPGIYKPCYNCAPSQSLPVISNQNTQTISFYRWGMIPFWAKESSLGNKLINARAETAAKKPSFRHAMQKQRCLIPATGFFEWKKYGQKQPWFFYLPDLAIFSFAGLWDVWKDAEGQSIASFTILTTQANSTMKDIHHRMPVILTPETEKIWLDSSKEIPEDFLSPLESSKMRKYTVSNLVNKPENDFPEIIKPTQSSGSLFN